jgi:hypothetical protein
MLVQWKQVKGVVLRWHGGRVCSVCRERYEPCVEVGIVGVYVPHLFPPIFFAEDEAPRYAFSFCGIRLDRSTLCLLVGLRRYDADVSFKGRNRGRRPLSRVSSKYADARFLEALVRHYPQLLGYPLTESVLREAGCDIEAEWALWQLSGGE